MSFFKKIFVVLAMLGLMIPSFAFADNYGLDQAAGGTDLKKFADTNTSIPNLIGNIVGVALSFLGAIFFLLILYAGFLWMTAFGDSTKADKAKGILEHAAVGLLIVLAAYAISRFVFSSLKVGEGASGGSSAASQVCPIGSDIGVTQCGPNTAGVCQAVGQCVDKCEYINNVDPKNYSCTDVSATGGECPGGRVKKITDWCLSTNASVVCCHDP